MPEQHTFPQVIDGYGPGCFSISGIMWRGAIIVLPHRTQAWTAAGAPEEARVASLEAASIESLAAVTESSPAVELLLLGCGPEIEFVGEGLRTALRSRGIALEVLDTGAACRTYNVLAAEGRRVACALIPLPEDETED